MHRAGCFVLCASLVLACGSSSDESPFSSSGAGGSSAAGSGTAGSGTSGSGTAGTGTSGSGTAGSGTAGSGTSGSGTAGTGTSGSGTSGSGTAGTGTSGSGTAGSGTSGSGTAGTGTSGSGTSGSGTSGSGTAGTGTAGTGTAGSGGTCTPGETSSCYDGPPETVGKGPCQGGEKTCDAGGTWGPCQGQVIPVPDACDGVDTSCDDTWTVSVPSVCPTIQAALDAAAASNATGIVTVAAGTYPETLDWKGARVRVTGAGIGKTFVDGKGLGSVVRFENGETGEAQLDNMTLKNGSGTPGDMPDVVQGGCVRIVAADPVLEDLEFTGCKVVSATYGYGAGVFLRKSSAVLRRLRFVGNQSNYYGGGIALSQSDGAVLEAIDARGNTASYGGGIASYFSSFQGHRLLLAGNTGSSGGGGLFVQGASPVVTNVTCVGNSSTYEGGGIYATSATTLTLVNASVSGNKAMAGGGFFTDTGVPAISYSDFFGNTGGDVAGTPPLVGVSGNFSKDPKYVLVTGPVTGWDLHPAAGSPLVDAGDPQVTDADGSACDVGAYGGP